MMGTGVRNNPDVVGQPRSKMVVITLLRAVMSAALRRAAVPNYGRVRVRLSADVMGARCTALPASGTHEDLTRLGK